ncbi:hypothetical protein HMPREF1869_01439 [Bacteroidales bacterium KA00251]|nr:hypothetical protein HMPREF1869_01439 [Bacteroidales bacterium KA00251]
MRSRKPATHPAHEYKQIDKRGRGQSLPQPISYSLGSFSLLLVLKY